MGARTSRQNLSAAQQTQLFTAFASAADMLDLGLAHMATPSGLRVVGVADTPTSMVNFAGIQYNLGFTADQTLAILMTGGSDPDYEEQFRQIREYLEAAGEGTPQNQFASNMLGEHQRLFDTQNPNPIRDWSIQEAEQVIQQWLQQQTDANDVSASEK